jgi:hypothetical protein
VRHSTLASVFNCLTNVAHTDLHTSVCNNMYGHAQYGSWHQLLPGPEGVDTRLVITQDPSGLKAPAMVPVAMASRLQLHWIDCAFLNRCTCDRGVQILCSDRCDLHATYRFTVKSTRQLGKLSLRHHILVMKSTATEGSIRCMVS